MNPKYYHVFVWLLLLMIGGTACQAGGKTETLPPTFTIEPSPTRIHLPPALTPTVVEPTVANTPVVLASYTPKPATDTPAPTLTPTDAPTSAVTEMPAEEPVPAGPTLNIDWEDTDGEPTIFTGEDEGYFIWTDGDHIHLRGVTKETVYFFTGQATGDGAMVNIDPVGQKIDFTIGNNVNQVDFKWMAITGTEPEGIDFSFNGGTLLLDLKIEGDPPPEATLVFIGEDKRQVNSLSLKLER